MKRLSPLFIMLFSGIMSMLSCTSARDTVPVEADDEPTRSPVTSLEEALSPKNCQAPTNLFEGEANHAGNHQGILDYVYAHTGKIFAQESLEGNLTNGKGTGYMAGNFIFLSGHALRSGTGGFLLDLDGTHIRVREEEILFSYYHPNNPLFEWSPFDADIAVAKSPIEMPCYVPMGKMPMPGSFVNVIGMKDYNKYILSGIVEPNPLNPGEYFKIIFDEPSKRKLAADGYTTIEGFSGGPVFQNDSIVGVIAAGGMNLDYGIAYSVEEVGDEGPIIFDQSTEKKLNVKLRCSSQISDHLCYQALDGFPATYWSNRPAEDEAGPEIYIEFPSPVMLDDITLLWGMNCASQYTMTATGPDFEKGYETFTVIPTPSKKNLENTYTDTFSFLTLFGKPVQIDTLTLDMENVCDNGHFLSEAGFYSLNEIRFGFTEPSRIVTINAPVQNP